MSYRHLNIVKENDPEAKARGLLREMVGNEQFRNYVRKGFVTVKGASGIIYKVSQDGIRSYARTPAGGYKQFEHICVVFRQALPPTDAVAMRLLLLRYDEFAMRARANVSRLNAEADFDLGAARARLAALPTVHGNDGIRIGDITMVAGSQLDLFLVA
jgi:hypothetical protein